MLHLAAQRGNIPVVEYLIHAAKDPNIDRRDSRGRTVLHYAVENKRACDTLTILVSHGADIWARDCREQSALHHAAKLGNLPAVKALLALGMVDELSAADRFEMTPLKIAAHHKAQAMLTFLEATQSCLERGKQPSVPGLVGCEDLSAVKTDSSLGTSLSSPAQTRYDDVPMRPLQDYHWIARGWTNLSRRLQRHQCRLSDLKACNSVIKHLVVAFAIWMLIVFLAQ